MALLHIYDSSDSGILQTANRTIAEKKLPVPSVEALMGELDKVVASGKVYDRILFETHGKPGKILFNKQPVEVAYWERIPTRYNSITAQYTRIYFNGCNVADYGAGWKFLEAVAKVFMTTTDGEIFAQTGTGWTLPFITNHTFHILETTKTLYVKGGKIVERFEQ